MKNIIFKLIHQNWGMTCPGMWNNTQWILYDDLCVVKQEDYNEKVSNSLHQKISITNEEFVEIKKLIEESKQYEIKVEACDGDAWEFIYYDNTKVIWKRELDYIYGIKPLEKLTKIFESLN